MAHDRLMVGDQDTSPRLAIHSRGSWQPEQRILSRAQGGVTRAAFKGEDCAYHGVLLSCPTDEDLASSTLGPM